MKTRLSVLFLIAALGVPALTGCSVQGAERKMASAGRVVESRAESIGETLTHTNEAAAATSPAKSRQATTAGDPAITLEKAQEIALKHAGFTADQVTALHTEYEVEHGVPQYDVEFHHEHWEYDYEINAETGEIMSYSKDD